MSRVIDNFFDQITSLVETEQRVRLHFKSNVKVPVVGKFVHIEDWHELRSKGFARFVPDGHEEAFGCANDRARPSFTLLYKVEDFLLIKII